MAISGPCFQWLLPGLSPTSASSWGTQLSHCHPGSRRCWGRVQWRPRAMICPPLRPHRYFILITISPLVLGNMFLRNPAKIRMVNFTLAYHFDFESGCPAILKWRVADYFPNCYVLRVLSQSQHIEFNRIRRIPL